MWLRGRESTQSESLASPTFWIVFFLSNLAAVWLPNTYWDSNIRTFQFMNGRMKDVRQLAHTKGKRMRISSVNRIGKMGNDTMNCVCVYCCSFSVIITTNVAKHSTLTSHFTMGDASHLRQNSHSSHGFFEIWNFYFSRFLSDRKIYFPNITVVGFSVETFGESSMKSDFCFLLLLLCHKSAAVLKALNMLIIIDLEIYWFIRAQSFLAFRLLSRISSRRHLWN